MTDRAADDRACPLCGRSSDLAVWQVPADDVWQALDDQLNAAFPTELRSRYTPPDDIVLVHCEHCDLDYFSPHNQGGADFYEALMAQIAYDDERWEFGVVQGRLKSDDAVVDYGCGAGAFLQQITATVDRVAGVDLNQHAVAALRDRHIEAFCGRPAEFAASTETRFDVACAFQIVEHLTAVDDLLAPLRERLADDGRVFISVPNRHRLKHQELEPLDCPPHHVSRWSATALQRLAVRYGLELVRIDYAPPTYGDISVEITERLQRVTRGVPTRARPTVTRAVRVWLLGPRRHEALNRRNWWQDHNVTGHTMLAEFRVSR